MSDGAGPLISACIIARDEERLLPECLASVAFCDEVVVVDSGSTDRTPAIARAAGAVVVDQPWLGYGAQRNVALDHARGAWALEVDADERVSPELAAEILRFVRDAPAGVTLGGLPLREHLVGHVLGPSSKYPKYRHRLLRRDAHRHDERRLVHEGLVPDGPVHPFAGDLEHLLATSWGEAVGDAWRYARLEAAQLRAPRTARTLLVGALARPAAKAAYRVVVDGGWRDGAPGLAKIALDCGTDVAVWLRHALGRPAAPAGDSGRTEGQHYGAWTFRRGDARMVAVALGTDARQEALAWLADAAAAGADVVLVTDGPGPSAGPRVRRLAGRGPFALARALEAEEQLRSYDVLVTFGARARRLAGLLPGRLRGAAPAADGAREVPEVARGRALAAREAVAA